VLWHRDHPHRADHFEWRGAVWTLHVPMIRGLFEQIATPSRLKPLGIDQTLDWAGAALNRVDRAAFFRTFEEQHAVQYFYEPFLKAYDPELRKALGVWYTPPEIVRYQVERVDRALRDELGLADGLADESVVVLDPCCGTGAYLVEALRRIHTTLEAKGAGALAAQRLKRAAAGGGGRPGRVFGFELLPAPFVVAHLQLGLLLRGLGAPLDDDGDERAGVYLTNSLTGWEPPAADRPQLPFAELEAERDAAERVKQETMILVILGNPPYNAFAGVSPEEEGGLVDAYKVGLNAPASAGGWGIKKFNLDDLYVRFFRIAERRIVLSGRGVVCYISNFSYLGDPSFVVMRQRLLGEFDKLWFDCLNGDSRETGKLTPEGKPDPSVFSTEQNREGIRVGTAIGLLVRKGAREAAPTVRFRHFWGATKRADLLASLDAADFDAPYQVAAPGAVNRFSFRPAEVGNEYLTWPLIPELGERHFNGPVERRGLALISMDRAALAARMKSYFDPKVSDDAVRAIYPSLMMTGNRIVGPEARRKILSNFHFNDSRITPYPFKPFDTRWCYLENLRPLFSEPSPDLLDHRHAPNNAFFITRDTADKSGEGPPFLFSRLVCDYDSISGHARHFPVRLYKRPHSLKKNGMASFFDNDEPTVAANLSPTARAYLRALGLPDPDDDPATAALIWLHALAVGYSPAYLRDNADGIRGDWPRIPLPASAAALRASAALGGRVAALLDTERPVAGVTAGAIRPALRPIAVIRRAGGGQLDTAQGHLDVTAGWGHAGKEGVTMPGRGKLGIRNYELGIKTEPTESASSDAGGVPTEPAGRGKIGARFQGPGAREEGSSLEPGTWPLEPLFDIYLNDHAYWADVPAAVWEYTIGGYQVMKKWLSYRERSLLGRGLTLEEAAYVTEMARRLAALVLLRPELDANYGAVVEGVWAWPAA